MKRNKRTIFFVSLFKDTGHFVSIFAKSFDCICFSANWAVVSLYGADFGGAIYQAKFGDLGSRDIFLKDFLDLACGMYGVVKLRIDAVKEAELDCIPVRLTPLVFVQVEIVFLHEIRDVGSTFDFAQCIFCLHTMNDESIWILLGLVSISLDIVLASVSGLGGVD